MSVILLGFPRAVFGSDARYQLAVRADGPTRTDPSNISDSPYEQK